MTRKLISVFLIFSMLLCIISCNIDIPVYATSSKMENAINWAISIANDDSHGYSMSNRWGPDYDCSSFVISALKYAGYDVGSATYTGDMKANLTARGFVWIPWSQIGSVNNLQRGDILLNEVEHTEIYLGNGYNVGAHSSRGNPQSGDQTGTEVSVSGYYYHPWDGVLREQNRMLPGTIDSEVKTPVTQTASKKISTYDEYGNIESNHNIDPGDSCTILEVYTNGFVKVQYPVPGGTRCAYVKREDFPIMNESNCPSGYTIKSTASIYGCQKVTVTVEPYDSGITNYKLYFIRPDGSTITVDLGTSNTLSAYANNLGTWKVYAEVSNGSGSYCGSINDGCVSFNVTAPDMGSKVDLGTDFVAYIANSDSGNVLSNDGDNVSCRTNTSEKSQQWLFRRKSDGSYEIESLSCNGKCLDAYSGKGYQGDNVQVYKGDNETLQSWNLYSTGDGSYYLMPACSNSAVLNIDGSTNLSGVNVNIWSYNQSTAQKFLIKKLEDTTLSLSSRSVELDLNGTNTATIIVSADGALTSNNYFTCSRDTSVMSTTWGTRNGNTNELTLKGKKTGTYTIYVSLIDGYTLETLNEESITVRITCSHNYGSWNTTKPATCTENGEKQRECSVCGKIEKKTIYTGGHMKVAISAVAPTCTTNGKQKEFIV